MRAIRRFTVRPVLPEPLRPLGELAANLRWSWHPETRELLESVDPEVWRETGGDPVRLLGAVSTARLAALAGNRRFLRGLNTAAEELRDYLTGPRWYQRQHESGARLPAGIGYFSPEFGITAALPQYSGGLGILAGDHLKSASDLGLPLIGVGLLYRHGYFRQSLSRDGWQQERYPVTDPDELPLTALRDPEGGSPLMVTLALPAGGRLHARVWCAQVGRVPLLLLDTDIDPNGPAERDVTDRLYGGGSEHRLRQEMLLGIGGVRAVRAYCRITGTPDPEVFHTNEGHAGFLGLERIRELMAGQDAAGPALDFDSAVEAVRGGTVFTTHTPVPAGIDRFERPLLAHHFGTAGDEDGGELPGVPVEKILALGAETWPNGDPKLFNMAAMGLRLAQRANGVSLLHGQVGRQMFGGLWRGFDTAEVPISSVTNGVHGPTWMHPAVYAAGAAELGSGQVEDRITLGTSARWDGVARVSDEQIFRLRRSLRAQLVEEIRLRLRESWRQRGAGGTELGWISGVFDPDVLTIGFARRVPSYKRLTLMLRDRERLSALLLHAERPVQFVVAGKAHPADEGGKRLIQELVRFTDEPRVRHRIAFLPDYDMSMARHLVSGCDVWLNNPLRPLEACGTSGMKAALNGCLNLSVLDGWWDEWFDPEFGWAIPTADGTASTDPERRDDLEAAALYELIEEQVAPRFYDHGPEGLPARWLQMVRGTLTDLAPKVLAGRMVRQYTEQLYAPAAAAHRALRGPESGGEEYQPARELAAWKARLALEWPSVRVDHVESTGAGEARELGSTVDLRVRVTLGGLTPSDVQVQAVSGHVDNSDHLTTATTTILTPAADAAPTHHLYQGTLTLNHPGPFGYTVRILPTHPLLATPAEPGLIALPSEEVIPVEPGLLR
jgi:starch phosphorylase